MFTDSKRLLSLLLALLLFINLFPAALAEDGIISPVSSGQVCDPPPSVDPSPEETPEESPEDSDSDTQEEDSVVIDEALFPDPVFRGYVSTQIDENGDGLLNLSECANVIVIDLRDSGVTSLEGIQLFSLLQYLYVGGTPDLPGCLTQLDLSGNGQLLELELGCHPLSSLDVSALPLLELLDVRSCGLNALDLSANTALKTLRCENNALSSLDLQGCTDLSLLSCYGNDQLTGLDIRPCPTLVAAFQEGGRSLGSDDSITLYGGSGDDDYTLAVDTSLSIIAEDPAEDPITGTCGNGLFWSLEGGVMTIYGTGEMKNWSSYTYPPWKDYRDQILHVVFLPGVTTVGNYAFFKCKNLSDITLPDSVLTIGNSAFESCENLREVILSAGLKTIGKSAFATCLNLQHIDVPDTVTSIGARAFNRCETLSDFTFPPHVTVIEDGTFFDCYGFTRIEIPEGVTSIGDQAFCRCLNLYQVTLPESLTTIKNDGFYYCPKLESITFPANVTYIGGSCFLYCYDLKIIRFEGPAPTIANGSFGDDCFLKVEADVYFPAGDPSWTEEAFKNHGGKLNWVASWKNLPRPQEKDLTSERLVDYAVVVYENHNLGKNQADDYRLASDVMITCGGTTLHSDSKGAAKINLDGSVTFEKAGYISRTLTAKQLLQNNAVYLEKQSSPVILAVWARSTEGYDWDVRHQTLEVLADDCEFWLDPEVYWGDCGPGTLYLYQEGKQKELPQESSAFCISSAEFDLHKPIYLVAKDSLDQISKRELKVKPLSKVPDTLKGLSLKFDADLSTQLPSSAGPFEGTKIKLKVPFQVPLQIQVVDGKWYGAIGLKEEASYTHLVGFKPMTYAKRVQSFENSFDSAASEIEKIEKMEELMRTFNGKTAVMKGSWGVDGSVSVIGYVEGYFDEQGHPYMSSSGVFMLFSGSQSFSQPFLLGPVPMFWKFSLGADFSMQVELAFNQGLKELTTSAEMEFSLSPGLEIGLGINKFANIVGGISGKLKNRLKFEEGTLTYYQLIASLNWSIKFNLFFFTKEYSNTISSATWYEWPEPGSIPESENAIPSFYDTLFDTAQYQRADLRYLTAGSPMIPGSASVLRADLPAQGVAPFLANAYEGADPQALRFSDGTMLAVWIGCSGSDSVPDGLQLFYSFFDGLSWSEPLPVESDGTMDASPALALCGDTAWLIWQDCCGTIPTTASLDDVAGMMGISAACFDRNSLSFTAEELAQADGSFPAEPLISSDGNALHAVWRQNTAGDVFGLSGEEQILCSSLTEGAWSAPVLLYTACGPILSLSAETVDGGLSVAWCCDMDGDLSTSEDLEIFRNGARITENEWMDSGVVFCAGSLFWYSGGLLLADGSPILPEGTRVESDRFQVVYGDSSLAILYTESAELATILKAIVYDGSRGAWGSPVTVSDGNSSIPYFSVTMSAGELSVLMERQAIAGEPGDSNPYGACTLQWYNIPLTCDIALAKLGYDKSTYQEGYEMTFTADVHNKGLVTVNSVLAEILDADGTVLNSDTVSISILPGETKQVQVRLRVESIVQSKVVTIRVTPADRTDMDPDNNYAEAVLSWNDLSVEKGRFGISPDGEYIIHANLVNRGHDPQRDIIVELHAISPGGVLAGQLTVPVLAPFSTVPISFPVGRDPALAYYVVTAHRVDDCDGSNDQDLVTVEREQFTVISFDAAGGSVEADSCSLLPGESIGALPIPVRQDWVFLGWFMAPAETPFDAGQGTPVTTETTFDEDVTVYAHWRLPGDVNGDGSVDNKDVTRLIRYLRSGDVDAVEPNLNTNGDGTLNSEDVIRLIRYLKYHDVDIR